ncbi:sterol carrier family protein [Hoyosella sp. YIM 151337]|uniref:sterol carrier family protein n=1 Tax=Hoyosella sp. YIM 151337 TaxID=2992742 RepID=UPI002235EC95|nr:sterol carrier family protein [Hoyosella sp. YIM 151337]MCW4354911.1 sterol carrier family protein [Hoyosella sp. YIM 151337]
MTRPSARRRSADPEEVRAAVLAIAGWLRQDNATSALEEPPKQQVAAAVRLTAQALAQAAPGASVEVRVPPLIAVQCIEGPRHTRGTPPNVMETDARTWLLLAAGRIDFQAAVDAGDISVSGTRAGEIVRWLPIVRL